MSISNTCFHGERNTSNEYIKHVFIEKLEKYFTWISLLSGAMKKVQGPVVQSVVSLTSFLRVISLTVLADLIYYVLIYFTEKM